MPFFSTDHCNPATLVADSGHTVGMLDHLESHVPQMGTYFIRANTPAGQLGMKQFQRFAKSLHVTG